jgi:hypothetical protein
MREDGMDPKLEEQLRIASTVMMAEKSGNRELMELAIKKAEEAGGSVNNNP